MMGVEFEGSNPAKRPSRGVNSLAARAVVWLLAPVALIGLMVGYDWYYQYTDTKFFADQAGDVIVIGSTPAQVTAILGTADDDSSSAGGYRELTYRHGEAYLKVMFQDGVAVRTMRWIH